MNKTEFCHQQHQSIDLETLKQDPNSLLSWGISDSTLYKLETYRLYRAGVAVTDIAKKFGFSRTYLYQLWEKFQAQGIVALVDKRWGTAPRKRTTEKEAAILRAKALNPKRGDSDLAEEFGLERSTVYQLLKEHGLQDLHHVIGSSEPDQESSDELEKKI